MKATSTTPANPFITEGYSGSKYFCDRKEESANLIKELQNGNNVTLFSPRRMGKTGLIFHCFEQLRKDGVQCIYLDILNTWNLQQFINKFASAVIGSMDSKFEAFIQKALKVFGHLSPSFSIDPVTGAPSMSLDYSGGKEDRTLESIFSYLKKQGKRCCIAIDEFQQIREYPEKGTEALLRSHIQFMNGTSFIFSGSKRHLMMDMFCNPQKPFYESTSHLYLAEIDKNKYYLFANAFFKESGRSLDGDAFSKLYDEVAGHTWYVQKWLNTLYFQAEGNISEASIAISLQYILRSQQVGFSEIVHRLSSNERKVLTAIANEGVVKEPQSAVFIRKYNLPAASSVKYCLSSLINMELVYESEGQLTVYNKFLSIWLRH